jgi:hypothetical protein
VVKAGEVRKKDANIALVVDERLTRDRRGTLSRVISAIRHFANVQIFSGETSEDELLPLLQKGNFSLVLAPWYNYIEWTKVEALFGLTRANGPTFAGYICDPIDASELGSQVGYLRAILLDFSETHPHEVALLVHSLAVDLRRTGIRPLLDAGSTAYCDNWYGAQGLGSRLDAALSLPELGQHDWQKRVPGIRLALSALWSLVYDEGSGKSELSQAINGGKSPRAYLQIGCDSKVLVLRLFYLSPGSTAKGALASFWPDPSRPTAAAQLLRKYADFLRVHTVTDGQEIEVTIGFFKSSCAEKSHRRAHTFWIEPVSPNLIVEVPFEAPGPESPHLKALIPASAADASPRTGSSSSGDSAKERFIFESAVKIRELKKQLADRDELVKDLKSGGVGRGTQALPPPDAENLLEAFQQKYFEARFQIRQFELQIAEFEQVGASPQEIEALKVKMQALAAREEGWIRALATTLRSYRDAKKSSSGGGGG